MDRQMLLATLVALALAATVKVVTPVETTAYAKMTRTQMLTMPSVRPDIMRLVGP